MKKLTLFFAFTFVLTAWSFADDDKPGRSPEEVVITLIETMAVQDGEQIRALFAADAAQAYGTGRAKSGPAFFCWLESDIIRREGQVDDPEIQADGHEVVVTPTCANARRKPVGPLAPDPL
jgi:hypothetical protein